MVRSAKEVSGYIEAVKKSWTKIEELSYVLKDKLILAHMVDPVDDLEKALEDLDKTQETYLRTEEDRCYRPEES